MNENGKRTENRSYLVAECGSVMTTVALFDVAGGSYRLVARSSAPTTARAPWLDLLAGVQQAVAQLTEITGRVLLTDKGDLIRPEQKNGSGVDSFVFTISAGEPLTAMVVGLLDDVSLNSARRALHSLYVQELDHISLADDRSQQEQIFSLMRNQPDIVLIAGGTEGGADERLIHLVETVEIGASLQLTAKRPVVVYAGNSHLREQVTSIMADTVSLHIAENVRPALEIEELTDAIRVVSDLYDDLKVGSLPGINALQEWCEIAPLPVARAFGGILEYLAVQKQGRVLGLDLGANSITFVSADADQVRLAVRSDLGVGQPLISLAEEPFLDEILAWLPIESNRKVVLDYIHNKALAPHTVPVTEKELYIEQAIARVLIRRTVEDAAADWGWTNETSPLLPPFDLLVIRGCAITHAPRPGQVMAMVLDALQPTGAFSVAIDRYGILPALGALAPYEPIGPVQVLDAGALVELGWVVVPVGRPLPEQRTVKVRMDAARTGSLQMEVALGELEMLPLSPGEEAKVILEPQRRIDVGAGIGRKRALTIQGGALGLVIDARGRPIPISGNGAARLGNVRRWLQDLGA